MKLLTIASVVALIPVITGFSVRPAARVSNMAPLSLAGAFAHDLEDESSYRYLLAKARECAFSENPKPADAKRYLLQILELEAGCVSGNLAGHDICDNVDEVAVIVAHLREKVEQNAVFRYAESSGCCDLA